MCQGSNSVSRPPVLPLQQPQEEKNKATAGGMASRRALKRGEVRRYSAEERRESIERYRSKRNRRNFKKKTTYDCRKKLADKRKRVRGRFAHTRDEKPCLPEMIDQTPGSSTKSLVPEWWPAMEEAMARKEEEDSITNLILRDWEMVATYIGLNLC